MQSNYYQNNYPYNYPNCYRNENTNPYFAPAPYMRQESMYNSPVVESQMFNIPDSWTFGPLKIEWSFNGESISVALKMFENAIREFLLTLSNPRVNVTTTLGDATINLVVDADFVKNRISLSGAFCVDTTCTTFNNTIIAKW